MIRKVTTCVWVALAAQAGAGTVLAQGRQRMTFKNNLIPGHLTRHRITRTIRRTAHRRNTVETLTYKQQGQWVQCNMEEPQPGRVKVYQMMADEPARVLRVFRGDKKISPTPPAARYGLGRATARLRSSFKTPRDAPGQVPLTELAERAVLSTMLDSAHWPSGRVDVGHRWRRRIQNEGFVGSQEYEFMELVKAGDGVAARVGVSVQGQFTGGLERNHAFDGARAVLLWSRPDRVLLKLQGQARWRRKRTLAAEELDLKLDVKLLEAKTLGEQEQGQLSEQLTVFADALNKLRAGNRREALKLCRSFRRRWPSAIWLAAVDELRRQAIAERAGETRLSTKALKAVLAKSYIAWEAARAEGEDDLLEQTQHGLTLLVASYRSKFRKMAHDEDEDVRGRAAFAMAFGDRPEDLTLVQKAARDPSPRVRAMALSGLAARGSPDTNVELLTILLKDEEAGVRRRACDAIAACVAPEHFAAAGVVKKIDELMIYDKSPGVRLAAVRALAAIGAPVDVAKLEKALTHELHQGIRAEIRRAIEELRNR